MKRKIIISVLFLAVAALIALVAFLVLRGVPVLKDGSQNKQAVENKDIPGSVDKETQKLIDEVKNAAKNSSNVDGGKQEIGQVVTFTKDSGSGEAVKTEQAVVIAPNSNPISVETGKVLTHDGLNTATNVGYAGDPGAPLESAPISDVSKLPDSVIKISAKPDSMTPNKVEVKAGQAVALAVTAGSAVVIFKFDDPSLSAVALGLKPGETREITFNAPTKPGNYLFFSDYPGQRSSGAEGVMIVK